MIEHIFPKNMFETTAGSKSNIVGFLFQYKKKRDYKYA